MVLYFLLTKEAILHLHRWQSTRVFKELFSVVRNNVVNEVAQKSRKYPSNLEPKIRRFQIRNQSKNSSRFEGKTRSIPINNGVKRFHFQVVFVEKFSRCFRLQSTKTQVLAFFVSQQKEHTTTAQSAFPIIKNNQIFHVLKLLQNFKVCPF